MTPVTPGRAGHVRDAIERLLWSCLIHGVPVWRLRGILQEMVWVLEELEDCGGMVSYEICRRKRRWNQTR